jgi:hypothetical protein
MRRFLAITTAALIIFCAADSASAQEFGPHSKVGVALKVSTLGMGVDAAFPLSERTNIRVGVNAFTFNKNFDDDGIALAAALKLRSFNAYLDWFAFGGGFHISPGVMLYNGNRVNALATVPAGESFDLGDEELFSSAANPVTGTATIGFQKVAPLLLIGWGNILPRANRRWSIPFELGVVYSRAPTTSLELGGMVCDRNGVNCRSLASDPGLQADMAEQELSMDSDLSPLKIIPVLSIGFSYKF